MGVNLSSTLPRLLAERGWTQDRLADEAQIRRTDVNALIRGRISAGPVRLERIAVALGVSVLDLGAPAEQAGPEGRSVLDRLEVLEKAFYAFVEGATERLAALEEDRGLATQRSDPE